MFVICLLQNVCQCLLKIDGRAMKGEEEEEVKMCHKIAKRRETLRIETENECKDVIMNKYKI